MRGQTEAPFQLLIAAVMLAMLIPLAFYLFQQYQVWESQERIRNNMETLARELETVANLGEGQKVIDVDLSVYGGPNFRVDYFKLMKPGERVCMDSCHTPHCWMIRAMVNNTQTNQPMIAPGIRPVCIRIPFNVDVKTSGCPSGYVDLYTSPQEFLKPQVQRIVAIKEGYTVYLCRESNS